MLASTFTVPLGKAFEFALMCLRLERTSATSASVRSFVARPELIVFPGDAL